MFVGGRPPGRCCRVGATCSAVMIRAGPCQTLSRMQAPYSPLADKGALNTARSTGRYRHIVTLDVSSGRAAARPGPKCHAHWNSQGRVPSRDGGRIRHHLMRTILHHRRHPSYGSTLVLRGSHGYPSCIGSLPRVRVGIMRLGLTDLAGPMMPPIGKESCQ